jgi:hypothetical protein
MADIKTKLNSAKVELGKTQRGNLRFGQHIKGFLTAGAVASVAFLGGMTATSERADAYTLSSPDQTIHILCSASDPSCVNYGGPAPGSGIDADAGQTLDGTIFTANPAPTEPSTGTGVFNPFLRVQDSGAKKDVDYAGTNDLVYDPDPNLNPAGTYSSESGFNTDASKFDGINYETKPSDGKPSSGWTRSVLFGELDTSDGFVTLKLDANEQGSASSENNLIVITEMQIFVGPGLDNPEVATGHLNDCDSNGEPNPNCFGYSGGIFNDSPPTDNKLLDLPPAWTLDSATNQNVDIVLQASICDVSANANCGSGHGDMSVRIPVGFFAGASATDNFVLYFEAIKNHDGFEEWAFLSGSGGDTLVSEPSAFGLFGIAVVGMGYIRRRRRESDA